MLLRDLIHLSLRSLLAHRMRSALTILGIAMGIVAVILLDAGFALLMQALEW